MGQLEIIEESNPLHILLENIDDEVLESLIQQEKSLEKLNYYLKWKYDRISKNISERKDFTVKRILDSEESIASVRKSALKWALLIQRTNQEFISCMEWFNEKLNNLMLCKRKNTDVNADELFHISEVILDVKQEREQEILVHMDIENLKLFLFELTSFKLNSEYYTNTPFIFLSYFDEIYTREPNIVDDVAYYLIEEENFDFLSVIFNQRLHHLAGSTCFQGNCLWNLLKKYIAIDDNMKKKQALYMLSKTVEYFKKNNSAIIPKDLKTQSLDDWNLYFILLNLSREKQLHLIKPTLKLLSLIEHLHISWQLCLYKMLLNHSQLFVVYKTVEHLMNLKLGNNDNFREIVCNIINALNKYEYSDLSHDAYYKFSIFCDELDYKCYDIFFEEFMCTEWNPAAAWSFLKSTSTMLYKIPQKFVFNMLRTFKSLPHTYIKYGCMYLFFQRLFENRNEDIIEDIIHIGQFLLFSDSDIETELFNKVVEINKEKFQGRITELQRKVLDSITAKNNKNLHIYLELMEILQVPIDLVINIPCSNIGDIILLHFSNLKNPLNVLDYLLLRFECDDDGEYSYLSKYLDKLFLDQNKTNMKNLYFDEYNEKLENLWNISKHNDSKTLIILKMLAVTNNFESFMTTLELKDQTNCADKLRISMYTLWINYMFKNYPNTSCQIENFTLLNEKLQVLLESETEQSLYLVLENLELLLNCTSDEKIVESLCVYEECLKKICELPSALLRSYSVVLFRSIFHLKLFSSEEFIDCWKRWVASYFEDRFFESEPVMRVILEGCRKLILLKTPNSYILVPLILRGLLSGTIVQKYQSPNIILMELKMLSMESLYLLTKNNYRSISENLVEMLLNLYKKHYKTRYFPDSQIHFEKLRIAQALLLVGPHVAESRDQLVEFILNSFSEESHQPSVKQLLQWLLIILLSSDIPKHFEVVIKKINITSLSHPSSLVALIPVLFHVVLLSKNVSFWFQLTDALLPWTMGANFKLRLYSQVTLRILLKRANEKFLTEYADKYSFLENSISKVLEASGNAVDETIKYDLTFIKSFNHEQHYSIENIFINLPKILDVSSPEWKNVEEYNFSSQMDIEIKNGQQFPNKKIGNNIKEKLINITEGVIVQKKIIPWTWALEESTANKTLGNIICVASLLEKSSNLGGLSRTCEIFCAKQLVLNNSKIRDDKEFKNLSMSSENWVNVMEVKKADLSHFLVKMRQHGYSLIGLEQTSESVKLNDFKFQKKTVLMLGNEKEGIPADLLPLMDACVEIPQFGQTRSLNVHVAGAIFIWEYVKRYNL